MPVDWHPPGTANLGSKLAADFVLLTALSYKPTWRLPLHELRHVKKENPQRKCGQAIAAGKIGC
jgi:hypothetical protein